MEEENKVFHQAKAEVWEQLTIIENLMRIHKLGTDDEKPILDAVPTRCELKVTINDLTNSVIREIRASNVFYPYP